MLSRGKLKSQFFILRYLHFIFTSKTQTSGAEMKRFCDSVSVASWEESLDAFSPPRA